MRVNSSSFSPGGGRKRSQKPLYTNEVLISSNREEKNRKSKGNFRA